jgi:hypothetical protein
MPVEPTRSQNITVIGRRSAVSRGAGRPDGRDVPALPPFGRSSSSISLTLDEGAEGAVAASLAIAFSKRLRSPSGNPSFSRSPSVRSASTSTSILLSRKFASY